MNGQNVQRLIVLPLKLIQRSFVKMSCFQLENLVEHFVIVPHAKITFTGWLDNWHFLWVSSIYDYWYETSLYLKRLPILLEHPVLWKVISVNEHPVLSLPTLQLTAVRYSMHIFWTPQQKLLIENIHKTKVKTEWLKRLRFYCLWEKHRYFQQSFEDWCGLK